MESKEKSTFEKRGSGYKISQKRIIVSGCFLLVVIGLLVFFMSSFFDVSEIKINGNKTNADNTIVDISEILKGKSIFSLDVGEIEEKIQSLNNIAEVEVVRDLPSTVVINIVEKDEIAYIAVGESKEHKDGKTDSATGRKWNKYVGIDENGTVISVSEKAQKKIPLVTGVKLASIEQGQFAVVDEKVYAKEKSDLIYRIVSELKKQDIHTRIKEINLSDIKNIYMILDTDTLVNFGEDGDEDGDSIEYKIAFLKPIIAKPRQNGGVIELSDTNNVTERASK